MVGDGKKTLICGHRGQRAYGAENTISSLRYAMNSGVDMIETDLRMSADGVLFLMHNRELSTCTDGTGHIEDLSSDDILKINAAVTADSNSPLRIPEFEHPALLSDLVELALEYPDVILNLEFKDLPGRGGCSEAFAYDALDKAVWMVLDHGLEGRTIINSFSGRLVQRVFREYGRRFHYHTFYPWENNGEMEIPPQDFCEVVCPLNWVTGTDGKRTLDQKNMPDEFFRELSGYGMRIIVSGGNGDDECQVLDRMIEKGGSIIMTDNPAKVLGYFRPDGCRP